VADNALAGRPLEFWKLKRSDYIFAILVGVLLWLFAMVFVLPGTAPFILRPSLLLPMIAVSIIALWEKWYKHVPLFALLGYLFASLGISVITSLSIALSKSVYELILFYVLIYCCLSHYLHTGHLQPSVILTALRLATIWYMVAALMDFAYWSLAGGAGFYRPPAPNLVAAMINLSLFPALVEFLQRPRALLLIWIIGALGVLALTVSRGGWGGAWVGLLVLIALNWRSALEFYKRIPEEVWLLVIVLLGVIALLLVMHADFSMRGGRWEFWSLAWRMFIAHPITGAGPGTFQYFWVQAHPDRIPYPHAHSIVFNTLAETGLLGFAALISLAIALGRAWWKRWQVSSGQTCHLSGLISSVIAFGVQNLVDSTYIEPAVMFALAIIVAVALTPVKGETT